MTRKHFEQIAAVIASMPGLEPATRQALASAFAVTFTAAYPTFNSTRFIAACTKEPR